MKINNKAMAVILFNIVAKRYYIVAKRYYCIDEYGLGLKLFA